jgi:hypothetical protein
MQAVGAASPNPEGAFVNTSDVRPSDARVAKSRRAPGRRSPCYIAQRDGFYDGSPLQVLSL